MTTTQRGSAGTLLGGRYRLLGPMPGAGRSWRARDEIDDRPLLARAIELPDRLPDAERQRARQQALRDAAAVARVQHPGVAPVVDAVVEDGAPWVISVLPPGRSLGEIVTADGPVSPVAAALIGLQVLEALAAAGVSHGELTPYDVLIGDDGRVRVTGFATTPLGAVGTRGFGAPEGGSGTAADLWALGVTLHVAVEGRMPGGPRVRAGALEPVLDVLLGRDPGQRSEVDAVRRLLVDAAGEPEVPAPPARDVHDPEVAAALAAFDAALSTGPGVTAEPGSGATAQVALVTDAPEPTGPATEPVSERAAAGPEPVVDQPTAAEPASATPPAAPEPTREHPASAPDRRAAAPQPIPWDAPAAGKPRSAAPLAAQTPSRPASETSAEETPIRQGPVPDTPVPESAVPGSAALESAVPNTPVPKTAARETPIRETPIRETPVSESPVSESPVKQVPVGPVRAPAASGREAAAQQPGRQRAVLVGVGIAVALVAVAALLLPFLVLRGGSGDDPAPAAQQTVPAAATIASPEPADASPSPDTPIPPPAGWQLYRDPAGWSIALPAGWTATHRGTAVTFTKADRTLRVTERANPPADTYVAAQKLQPVIQAATPGYDFLRLANVTYRAWPTTDYEFRAGSTARTHSLIRSTVPSPTQVFDFVWTCPDPTWKADRALLETVLRTFDPGA